MRISILETIVFMLKQISGLDCMMADVITKQAA